MKTTLSRLSRIFTPFLSLIMAGIVFASVVVASIISSQRLQQSEDSYVESLVDQKSEIISAAISFETQRYIEALQNLSVAVAAQENFQQANFDVITSKISEAELPGSSSIAFVVPVQEGQVEKAQSEWVQKGATKLKLRPAKDVSEHKFMVFRRDFSNSTGPTGIDLSRSVQAANAMDVARKSAGITASDTFILIRDQDKVTINPKLSFVFVAPIYANGTASSGKFLGWLCMPMEGENFLANTLQRVSQGLVNGRLYNPTDAGLDVEVASKNVGSSFGENQFAREITVNVADRQWRLELEPTNQVVADYPTHLDEMAILIGILTAFLLSILVYVLASGRQRALDDVNKATEQLRADIAHRQVVESELRIREQELEAFAGIVAHDLRAPLGSMLGFSEMLADDYADDLDKNAKHYLTRIHEAGIRMENLIEDLLAYASAKDRSLDISSVDLAKVANEIVQERTQHLTESLPKIEIGKLPVVNGDALMLRQLLDNLIGNALKYVPPGETPHVEVTSDHSQDEVLIMVADHGIGIPKSQQETIFTPFVRTSAGKLYSGTGLGLAICQRIAQRHRGNIGVQDNDGGGSKFWISLPAN